MDVIYLALIAGLMTLLIALVSGCARLMQRTPFKGAPMTDLGEVNATDTPRAKP